MSKWYKVIQIRVHRYIMEQNLGRKLLPGEVVHHINGDKRDNRIENLEVMSHGEHSRRHYIESPSRQKKWIKYRKIGSKSLRKYFGKKPKPTKPGIIWNSQVIRNGKKCQKHQITRQCQICKRIDWVAMSHHGKNCFNCHLKKVHSNLRLRRENVVV